MTNKACLLLPVAHLPSHEGFLVFIFLSFLHYSFLFVITFPRHPPPSLPPSFPPSPDWLRPHLHFEVGRFIQNTSHISVGPPPLPPSLPPSFLPSLPPSFLPFLPPSLPSSVPSFFPPPLPSSPPRLLPPSLPFLSFLPFTTVVFVGSSC